MRGLELEGHDFSSSPERATHLEELPTQDAFQVARERMLENISRDPVLLLVYVHVGLRPGWGAQTSKAKDLVSNRGFNNLDSPTIPHLHKATSPAHAFRWPQAHSGPDLLPRCDHGVGFHSAASSPSAPLRSTPRAQNSSLPSASSPPANLQRQPPRAQKNVRFDIRNRQKRGFRGSFERGAGQRPTGWAVVGKDHTYTHTPWRSGTRERSRRCRRFRC